ncbi:TonB-linked outer membrane protein, SusC/RagA family [Chitinophaga costaii]|uniref:TonB-linked outer membrane protein, SusC/RagA family n=1 Tax=Chitinophaga costaii TaxID=1335309 RepID=A0A1C3YS80_9BACT|nr:SusC/RagA family TonB-linked outer membrane protein [Chitinophaga costaii]PUZ30083.1 SusC/RagA family TonB-linked outer membrane protein [Chitinophaga costaii]SCB72954.1 TonB-linked outer membrane protein, SusC/RagA family [Chitinophaga costaii]
MSRIKFLYLLLFSCFTGISFATAQKITGKVFAGEDQRPLAGVSILVKNTKEVVQTNEEGAFQINATVGQVLAFRYQGRSTVFDTVKSVGQVLSISLELTDVSLNDVVVTALSIKREKKAIGYAVQEISGADITKTKDQSIINQLSGKVAGVQVTSASGALGASARIVIRGNSSFGNNQPLFVVDGVPILNDATAVTSGQGVDYGTGAGDIDPENVESMSVLKGANAAALYGSRAANGVILITTKKGSNKRLGIDISSSLTGDDVYILPKYQNMYGQGLYGDEYIWQQTHPELSYQDYAKTYAYNYVDGKGNGVNDMIDESWGPRMNKGLLIDQFFGKNQPWISHPNNTKSFFETGITSNTNVAVTAGTDNARGRLSLSNMHAEGVLPNNDLDQKTINFSGSLTPTSRLTIETNVNYLIRSSDNIARGSYGSSENPFMSVGGWFGRQIDMKLLKQNWNKDDELGNPYNWQQGVDNPYLAMYKNTNAMDRHRIYGNVNAIYKLADWISVKGVVGTDYYTEWRKNVVNSRSKRSTSGGRFEQTALSTSETNADLMLLLQKKVSSSIRIDGVIGSNVRKNKYESMWLSASQLTVPDLYTIANVKGNISSSMYTSEKENQSVYASANVAYNNYLFLNLTGRNDWSSTLPAGNRSYFYPSVNAGFVFTDAFGIRSDVLSYGKLRLGWAQVGNDTDPYQTKATYSPSSTTWNGVTMYSYSRKVPPVNLKPEITTSTEAGVDLRFFRNRISLDMTYYKTATKNQILSVGISNTTGFGSALINAGKIQNAGIEVQLGAQIFDNPGGFNWNVMLNWARNKNKVVELYPGIESYDLGSANVVIQAVPGKPYAEILGGAYKRNDQGKIVVDASGLPEVVSNQPIGNALPKWTGGINNSFSYKNFNLSFLVDMRWGGDIFSYTLWHNQANGTAINTVENGIREKGLIVDAVKEDGSANDIRVSAEDYFRSGYVWNLHENSLIKGTYIKLRELALGYKIPVKRNKFLNSAAVSIVARNLALLYTDPSNIVHIDPETSLGIGNGGLGVEMYNLPSTRSIGLKVQLGF